jgi:hypothetical protein
MEEEPLTVQDFVLSHAIRVPVTTEADDHQPFVLAHREDDGAHVGDKADKGMAWG